MSILLFVALGGYLIAYRINQSAVVGIILAGILVGPSLLGLVTYTDFVSSLATLGAIVLLFTIGLEFEVKEIAKVKYFIIALLGVIVPWAGGYFLSKAFGYDFKAAVFIGTALTATSIAVTANVLREMGKLQTDAAKAIIGAAVVDDILALLALSLSESLVSDSVQLLPIVFTSVKAIGFIGVGILIGKMLLTRMLSRFEKSKLAEKYPESIFIFAMMVAFLYSIAAELVGLSAIVGSFLAGASFAGVHLKCSAVFKEGAEHLQIIFASIFFISLGVIMDLRVVTASLLWFVAALTIVAILTKVIGCGGAARILGLDIRNSLIVGMGMVPRGEVAMIVALIGLNQQLITQSTYSALILMALLTTVIPPIILRNWLFKERREKKQALTPS
ncbi:MAG: cation:proton antiporter [Dehalococcoidia bacterium]|nr:MAG: cation:proton antiporter [Dehalococcoidia bacterium]